jgi:hypothetical protein
LCSKICYSANKLPTKKNYAAPSRCSRTLPPPGPAGTNIFEVLRYTGDAQHGIIEWEWRGRHVGEFLSVPAAGKETVVRGITFHTYENGKIVREATFWDAVTALRQLGALKPTVEFWKVSGQSLAPSGLSV